MIQLIESPIDTAAVLAAVVDEKCGAEVLFTGTTRRWTKSTNEQGATRELETEHLIYEAYEEMAIAQLEELAATAQRRWPVERVAIVHRLGKVLPCEASVAVAVSCPHRSEAFEAGKWLIDTIKHDVPIWKQEHYVQSGPEWIHPTSGSCRCDSKESPSKESPIASERDSAASAQDAVELGGRLTLGTASNSKISADHSVANTASGQDRHSP
jgi:molybdopterin synthase catalytic subunit